MNFPQIPALQEWELEWEWVKKGRFPPEMLWNSCISAPTLLHIPALPSRISFRIYAYLLRATQGKILDAMSLGSTGIFWVTQNVTPL
jgi:hypothetical protein